jgi:hypothetical protein
MNERSLEYAFVTFLIEKKGYPRASLLLGTPIADKVTESGRTRRFIADLVVLDTDFNSYLALVEFKGYIKPGYKETIEQVKMYLKVLDKPELPAYLVTPVGSEGMDFVIHILDNNEWRKIEKTDFPEYASLSSKNRADEKINLRESVLINERLKKKRYELIKGTAVSTLLSLIVGIVSVFVLSKSIFFDDKIENEKTPVILCCDSLEQKTKSFKTEILILKKEIGLLKTNDSIIYKNKDNIVLNALSNRIKTLEGIINMTPDKLIKVQELNFEIKSLNEQITKEKEISEIKIQNLKDRIDTLTLWTSGIIITILGSIIGFAFNAFRKN